MWQLLHLFILEHLLGVHCNLGHSLREVDNREVEGIVWHRRAPGLPLPLPGLRHLLIAVIEVTAVLSGREGGDSAVP